MHCDAYIEYLLNSIEDGPSSFSNQFSYTQLLCCEVLTQTIQNCGQAFRSKFVITIQGIVKFLTIIDASLLE